MTTTVESRSVDVTKQWTEQAEDAIKTADTAKLRHLLTMACNHNVELARAFDGMLAVYLTSDKRPSQAESESAVAAMRDVSLAAIELCKATVSSRG